MKFREYYKRSQPYAQLLEKFEKLAKTQTLGTIGNLDLKITILNPQAKPCICFMAGVHGDEPGGSEAILKLLKDELSPKVIACPVANPTAFNRETRTGTGRLNMNRQFTKADPPHESGLIQKMLLNERPDLLVTLHEDPEANGFYIYYTNQSLKYLCSSLLTVAKKHMPIESRTKIYGDQVETKGIIHVKENSPLPQHQNSMEMWCHKNGTNYLCIETPTSLPLEQRAICGRDIMREILHKIES